MRPVVSTDQIIRNGHYYPFKVRAKALEATQSITGCRGNQCLLSNHSITGKKLVLEKRWPVLEENPVLTSLAGSIQHT